MKLIISGSRNFFDYVILEREVNLFILNQTDFDGIEIVSGGAYGADKLGEAFAKKMKYKLTVFKPDWGLGKAAGPIRNSQMANYATHCICFWDGKSKGTKNMIELCKRNSIPYKVIPITP